MSFELPPLPYPETALEPHYSAKTISFHYGKHHKSYATKLNTLVAGTEHETSTLEEIIRSTAGDESRKGLFNNAAQVWNHTFFWRSMTPEGGGRPSGELAQRIERDFGSTDSLAKALTATAVQRFGSGWAWLVVEDGTLKTVNTLNADNPLAHGRSALMTIDVWEHAYYLDYQNRRVDYVAAVLEHLVNWDFVASNLAAAS